MSNFLQTPLIFLFNRIEEESGVSLASFVVNETPATPKATGVVQPIMKMYQDLNNSTTNQVYKYLYDPDLSFSFRFHQRLSRFKYTDRKEPWVSLIFNTGEKRPLTEVVSHRYEHHEITENNFYSLGVRRSSTPVNLVFISNSIDYLYSFLGAISFYWDRITAFDYKQTIQYSNSYVVTYDLTGEALDIRPKDLNKLDTERRGSLVMAGYSFDLVNYEFKLPEEGHLLKEIDLIIKVAPDTEILNIVIQ